MATVVAGTVNCEIVLDARGSMRGARGARG